MKFLNNTLLSSLTDIFLFPFNNYVSPFQRGVQFSLNSFKGGIDQTKFVLGRGSTGFNHIEHVAHSGTVKRVSEIMLLSPLITD